MLLASLLLGSALVNAQSVGNASVPVSNPLTVVANSTVGKSSSSLVPAPPCASPRHPRHTASGASPCHSSLDSAQIRATNRPSNRWETSNPSLRSRWHSQQPLDDQQSPHQPPHAQTSRPLRFFRARTLVFGTPLRCQAAYSRPLAIASTCRIAEMDRPPVRTRQRRLPIEHVDMLVENLSRLADSLLASRLAGTTFTLSCRSGQSTRTPKSNELSSVPRTRSLTRYLPPLLANATASNTTRTSPTAPSANPLIPTTVSPACTAFLSALNADTQLSACTSPLLTTLALFAPSANSTESNSQPPAAVLNSLTTMCASPRCSDTLIRTAITAFAGNCSAELSAGNPVVLGSYDVLYILSPFMTAVCSKDGTPATASSSGFCLEDIVVGVVPSAGGSINGTIANSTAVSAESISSESSNSTLAPAPKLFAVQQGAFKIDAFAGMAMNPLNLFVQMKNNVGSIAMRLRRRQVSGIPSFAPAAVANSTVTNSTSAAAPSNSTASVANATLPSNASTAAALPTPLAPGQQSLLPNATTFRLTSLPFLFLSPNMSSTLLCTSCTKTILAAYVAWESRSPYALGLSNSPLLGGQGDLWTGVGGVCGGGFLESISVEAGQKALLSGGRRGAEWSVVAGLGLVGALFVLV